MLSEPRSTDVNCIAPRINPNYIFKLRNNKAARFLGLAAWVSSARKS
jgi:hypothetical protein